MSTPTSGARGGVLPLVERRRQFVTQQSTVWARKQHAVCVRRACKKYGSGKSPNVILNNLNMTVPKGCIYGLLGASGCGKTTLLSCIVGRRRLNSGEIWVLGGKPGSKGSGVPGPRIGYMPQEIALYGEFTIRETLVYFGWVNGMSTADVDAKVDFFINFLQLPDANRRVKNLSGGQQRRVSFAAAMVHEPELLILDEPTVGVDPVLRQSIWDHLVSITSEMGTTVIITTHYIDETRQAHTIGLMRGGCFLAEESPDSIMARYHSVSLEEAFLKLSVIQNRGKRRRSSILSEITAATEATMPEIGGIVNQSYDDSSEISGEFGESMTITTKRTIPVNQNADPLPPEDDVKWTCSDYFSIFSSNHMKALVWKNTLWMVRNIGLMLFIIGLPVAQIVLFCLSIGRDPRGLRLAVINHELDQPMSPCTFNLTCDYERFSCRYLKYLSQRHHSVVSYADEESAYAAVKGGHAWGMITFPANFSQNLEIRVNEGRSAEDSVLEDSEIDVQLDMSNDQIAFMLKRDLVFAFQDFTHDVAISCEVNPAVIRTPIRFHSPVYGPVVPNFTDFAAPGVILTIIFFLAVALTSGAMLIERNEGLLERGLVSGITGLEILAAHVITQFVVMLGQSVMVVVFALVVFDITNQGKVYWVLLLIILCGTCGMTFGFVVSCITDSERNATYLALGSFLPFVMLCGVIWPVQGMHTILRTVSYFLPLTLSTESLRNILARGWSIDEPTVYAGFISTVVWIFVLLNISVLLIKFRKG